jgi:hypothetical protein
MVVRRTLCDIIAVFSRDSSRLRLSWNSVALAVAYTGGCRNTQRLRSAMGAKPEVNSEGRRCGEYCCCYAEYSLYGGRRHCLSLI